jgi:hypothetical protein
LVARFLHTEEVVGSSPASPTTENPKRTVYNRFPTEDALFQEVIRATIAGAAAATFWRARTRTEKEDVLPGIP